MKLEKLGYREMYVLGRVLAELSIHGTLNGVPLGTELEIDYNPHTDILTLTDGVEYVEIDVADFNNNGEL